MLKFKESNNRQKKTSKPSGASTQYLYEYGHTNDDNGGGDKHVLGGHRVLVQCHHQSIADGAPEATVGHDELIDEADPLAPIAIAYVAEKESAYKRCIKKKKGPLTLIKYL